MDYNYESSKQIKWFSDILQLTREVNNNNGLGIIVLDCCTTKMSPWSGPTDKMCFFIYRIWLNLRGEWTIYTPLEPENSLLQKLTVAMKYKRGGLYNFVTKATKSTKVFNLILREKNIPEARIGKTFLI